MLSILGVRLVNDSKGFNVDLAKSKCSEILS